MSKYIKLFENENDRNNYENSSSYITPYVSDIKDTNGGVKSLHYNKVIKPLFSLTLMDGTIITITDDMNKSTIENIVNEKKIYITRIEFINTIDNLDLSSDLFVDMMSLREVTFRENVRIGINFQYRDTVCKIEKIVIYGKVDRTLSILSGAYRNSLMYLYVDSSLYAAYDKFGRENGFHYTVRTLNEL